MVELAKCLGFGKSCKPEFSLGNDLCAHDIVGSYPVGFEDSLYALKENTSAFKLINNKQTAADINY